MHWIQRHILRELAFSDHRRYAELKPDAVDGNLFQYHARQLERAGLILRSSAGYSLTKSGKSYVADLSQSLQMGRRQLSRAVVTVACRNEHGQYLLFKWRRQPYRGLISLPFGRQLAGQASLYTATEQLHLKTGYWADLRFVGVADIIYYIGSEVSHLSYQVFVGTNLIQVSDPDGLTGEYFWGHPSQLKPSSATAGFHQIIEWLESPKREPLLEVSLELPEGSE